MRKYLHLIKRIFLSFFEGTFLKKVNNRIIVLFRNRIMKGIEINSNKIVFLPFQGRFECNAKSLVNYIIDNKEKIAITWIAKEKSYNNLSQFPKELKVVKYNSKECYQELASAKVIIMNGIDLTNLKYQKKEGQYIIQTWHGSMGFKRIDTYSKPDWVKKATKLGSNTDFIISNSTFEEEVYQSTFWQNTNLLKYGHPRNDILFNKNNHKIKAEIFEKYHLPKDVKILLYAPTFRDNLKVNVYDIDYNRLKDNLEKKFGGSWVIMVRLHYKLIKETSKIDKIKNIINVSEYPDMQELLSISDIGITDYSSWMCDFVLTRRPGFLYAPDFEEYQSGRGFYYPLESTPFKICKNNQELEEAIINFDDKKYQKEVDKFLSDRGCYEEGNASKKLINKIKELFKN